jgi:hypothetical protein
MQELTVDEVDAVGGGEIDSATAIGTTIGLMALAPASVLVVTVGLAALAFHVTRAHYITPPTSHR